MFLDSEPTSPGNFSRSFSAVTHRRAGVNAFGAANFLLSPLKQIPSKPIRFATTNLR
jgi:hypothetical protein